MRYMVCVNDSEWLEETHEYRNFEDEIRDVLENAYITVEYIDEARDNE